VSERMRVERKSKSELEKKKENVTSDYNRQMYKGMGIFRNLRFKKSKTIELVQSLNIFLRL
jgi:hypothetical protein